MRRLSSLFLLVLLVAALTESTAQITNIKAMEGQWVGEWVNNFYTSTGDIEFTITVDEINQTAHGEWDVGGNILGEPRIPFTTDITLTGDGFTVDFNSPIWGDIIGTGVATGAFSGTAENCPNPNAQAIAATGTFNTRIINSTFTFSWFGQSIDGTTQMTKQNPVNEPTNLNAVETNSITISWDDNSDNETGFKLDRKVGVEGVWGELVDIVANTTDYLDENVEPETEYYYRISAYNDDTESEFSGEANLTTSPATGIADNLNIPADYMLMQNYPNPFNPATNIEFILPRESHVKLIVYSTLGEEVKILLDGYRNSGRYQVTFNSAELPSGIYLLEMRAVSALAQNHFVDIKKMVILK